MRSEAPAGAGTSAGILAGLAAGALWGLSFVAPRMASGFAAMDVTAGRFITYGLIALGMMAWGLHTRRLPTPRQFVAALMLSLLGFTGYYLLLVLAIRDMGVAIARAIVKRPDVLLCDEPTGALDYQTGKMVLEVIARINAELGTTAVVITHNAAIAAMADRVVYLVDGTIARIERNAHRLSPSELSW